MGITWYADGGPRSSPHTLHPIGCWVKSRVVTAETSTIGSLLSIPGSTLGSISGTLSGRRTPPPLAQPSTVRVPGWHSLLILPRDCWTELDHHHVNDALDLVKAGAAADANSSVRGSSVSIYSDVVAGSVASGKVVSEPESLLEFEEEEKDTLPSPLILSASSATIATFKKSEIETWESQLRCIIEAITEAREAAAETEVPSGEVMASSQ